MMCGRFDSFSFFFFFKDTIFLSLTNKKNGTQQKKEPACAGSSCYDLQEKLFLDNLLRGDTVVGDHADVVDAVSEVAHVDSIHVLLGHNGAAVDVDNADFLNALSFNVQNTGGGVRIEVNRNLVSVVDTSVAASNHLNVVNEHPVHIVAVVVTEGDADGLASES